MGAFFSGDSLRIRREKLGLNALQLAELARCPVETVLRAEFGMQVPMEDEVRARLAAAYGMAVKEYVDLAFDEAERYAFRQSL